MTLGRIGVMHLIDSLEAGGAERVAVNLVNALPDERYWRCLCTTRREGPLAELAAPEVTRLSLARRRRIDFAAQWRLSDFIAAHHIRILHAHGTALLVAVLASLRPPYPRVIWHDHYGNYVNQERPVWLYRLLARRLSGVIAVNQTLAEWAQQRLRVPAERVRYIPNFVAAGDGANEAPPLPGAPGKRIICTANFRPQKDHLTLLRAMALVSEQEPAAHLLLVGANVNETHFARVKSESDRLGLAGHVSFLGEQKNVAALLRGCDIGVLSSTSEGLPLALLEYGRAGLASVTTQVGQCAEVLDQGRAGLLVPPAAPARLADALLKLLRSAEERVQFGEQFRRRVDEVYSADSIIEQVCDVYDMVLAADGGRHG
jgi:glycosyltransferase involved in cell wall biosynthesis